MSTSLEEALRENERLRTRVVELERFEKLAAVLPFGVVFLRVESASTNSGDLRLVYANPKASEASSLDLKTFVGQTLREILPDDFSSGPEPAHVAAMRGAHQTGIPETLDVDRGERGVMHTHCLRLDDQLVATVYQNVTEQKRIEVALRDSEEFSRRVIDSSNDCIKVLDLEGHLLSMSAGGQKLLEIDDLAPLLNKSWVEFWKGTDREAAREAVSAAKDGAVKVFHGYCATAKGTPKWWEVINSPIRDGQGRVHRVLSVSRDITSRRQAEEQIKAVNLSLESRVAERTAQLDLANRELEAFSYSVAHDLRAPLRGMNGFAQVLLNEYAAKLDADGLDCLQEIHSNAKKMGELIDALLSLSRVTRSELQPRPLNLGDLARTVTRDLAATDPERRVEVTIQDGIESVLDPVLARLVVENLLGNAWKFTKQAVAARIEFGTTERDGARAFFVRDNGAGFDMAYASKLFSPFQRLHAVADYAGTGIGLATVQRIVHRHGGRVWAEGHVNVGATFYFTIPTGPQGSLA